MRRRITRSQAIPTPEKELKWDVVSESVFSGGTEASNYQALHRNDNNQRLSIVKDSYYPITNERLIEITHRLADFTGFKIEGYTSYQGGAKVLAYLKNNENYNIAGFDAAQYMIVGNSFDKTKGFFIGESETIFRCTNQFGMLQTHQTVRHTKKAELGLDELVRFYQKFVTQQDATKRKFETWHGIQIPEELKELFIDEVLEIDPDKVTSTRRDNQRAGLAASVNRECAAMGNTMFGLFNGLTHYTTHVLNAEKVYGNVLGQPARLNQRVMTIANRLVLEMA